MRFCERLFKSLCFSLILAASPAGWADDIDILDSRLEVTEQGCVLSAAFSIPLNAQLEDALKKGIPFHFILDFKLERPRWYWWNEEVVRETGTLQLSYHILTRRYQLSADGVQRQFASLDEALQTVSHVRDWQIRCKENLKPKQTYEAALQMRLDLSPMPRPFQVDAFSNEGWSLSSVWKRWKFVLPEEEAVSGNAADPPSQESDDIKTRALPEITPPDPPK